MDTKEKTANDNARVLRQEIIDIKLNMQWPTKTDVLKVTNFKIPKLLDSFLTGVLASNPGANTDRIARLKLSFNQDLIIRVCIILTFFCYIFRNTTS